MRNPFSNSDGFFANCLVTPYTIAASTATLCSIIFFVLFLVYPYDQPDTTKDSQSNDSDETQLISDDVEENSSTRPVSPQMHNLVILSSAVLLFVFVCSVCFISYFNILYFKSKNIFYLQEGTYFQFSASFGTKASHMSEPDAALLASALAISFTVFRALSILIALYLTAGKMIVIDLITVAIGNTLVYFFAGSNTVLLVVGVVFLGAGFASVFPCIFSHLEFNGFTITDMVGSLLTFSGGISEVLAPFLIGLYIDTKPYVLVYFTFLSVTLSSLALAALNFLIWFARRPSPSASSSSWFAGLFSRHN